MRPGEQVVRAETGTQQVWPVTVGSKTALLCAHHRDLAENHASEANRLSEQAHLPTMFVSTGSQITGPCAECTRRGMAESQIGRQRSEQYPGIDRHQTDVPRKRPQQTGPFQPLRQSENSLRKHNVLENPHTEKNEWYHGSPYSFDEFQDPAEVHPLASEYNDEEDTSHWNTLLGSHFAADHDVADTFTGDVRTGHMIHARLHIKNPKVYKSEYDMDQEAYHHEWHNGNYIDNHLTGNRHDDALFFPNASDFAGDRNHEIEPEAVDHSYRPLSTRWLNVHPDKFGIAMRFKDRLAAKGHDGVIYGNEYETSKKGSKANRCAIAFDPYQIEITQHHYGPDCKTEQEAEEARKHMAMPGQLSLFDASKKRKRAAPSRLNAPLPAEVWDRFYAGIKPCECCGGTGNHRVGEKTSPGCMPGGECNHCDASGFVSVARDGDNDADDSGVGSSQALRKGKKVHKIAHDSGDGQIISHCLAGETRFLTPDGPRTLAECSGKEVLVLTAPLGEDRGNWTPAHIHSFGKQRLWAVTLQRNKQTKVIHATEGHRWLVRRPNRILTTSRLMPGHRLAQLRMERFVGALDHEGIRHGFHFGDGVTISRQERAYGAVTLWGSKRDLADYFREVARAEYSVVTDGGVQGLRFTSGMKDYRKELPSLHMPAEYLYGWLAGYVAADGTVGRSGQVTMSSSIRENLEAVRDIATLLGIGTYGITGRMRQGFGLQPSMLFQMGLSTADLPGEFFLRADHRSRHASMVQERFGWTVVSIDSTERIEEVFCAVVPETESFALEDNIHTGNCPFCGSGRVIGRSDGSAECEFCNQAFTIQVQPMYPGFPQSIDGQPVQIPGMPGGPAGGGMGPGAPALPPPPGSSADEQQDDGDFGDGDQDEDEQEGPPDDDEGSDSGGGSKPPWLKGSMRFRTAAGDVLNEDAYVRHLAFVCAPEDAQEGILAAMRARRG